LTCDVDDGRIGTLGEEELDYVQVTFSHSLMKRNDDGDDDADADADAAAAAAIANAPCAGECRRRDATARWDLRRC
jgi:hypothetical protein